MKIFKLAAFLLAMTAAFLLSAVEVFNYGHSGWNSRQLTGVLADEVAKVKPDLVIIMIGTNDTLNSHNLVPEGEFRQNLIALVKIARDATANVLLCEIPDANQALLAPRQTPGFFDRESAKERIARTNTVIHEVAAQLNVPVVNTQSILGEATLEASSLFRNPANSTFDDGVHPTPYGYLRLAVGIAKKIQEEKWNPQVILCSGDSITFGVAVKGAGTAEPDAETYPALLKQELNPAAAGAECCTVQR